MTIRHLFGREDCYVITTDYNERENEVGGRRSHRLHGRKSLHTPKTEASIEWAIFGRGHGAGFELGRNGGESDIGLNLYAGPLASLWLRLRAPWTAWARVTKEQDPDQWYYARHTGIRIHPFDGCLIGGKFEERDGYWSKGQPWYRDWHITKTTILGRHRTESVESDSGVARVPLPEGVYLGTWKRTDHTIWHVRWPGTWWDRIVGPRRHGYIDLAIEGGIPVEGKGENSWDCGMDGLFGCSGSTVEDAIGNAVKSVMRDRQRYGGPHDLHRPMTVTEAENRHKAG